MNHLKNDAGVSLLEYAIAMGVVTIGLLGASFLLNQLSINQMDRLQDQASHVGPCSGPIRAIIQDAATTGGMPLEDDCY